MTRSSLVFFGCAALFAVCCSGCGGAAGDAHKTARVSGTVTFNGEPVQAGKVFLESDPPGFGGSGTITNGNFTIDGEVVLGTYLVYITPPPPAPPVPGETPIDADSDDIPEKYRAVKKSELTAEVTDGVNQLTFELE